MADNLPPGLTLADLEDDLHFISSDDEVWERELEKGDEQYDLEKNDL